MGLLVESTEPAAIGGWLGGRLVQVLTGLQNEAKPGSCQTNSKRSQFVRISLPISLLQLLDLLDVQPTGGPSLTIFQNEANPLAAFRRFKTKPARI